MCDIVFAWITLIWITTLTNAQMLRLSHSQQGLDVTAVTDSYNTDNHRLPSRKTQQETKYAGNVISAHLIPNLRAFYHIESDRKAFSDDDGIESWHSPYQQNVNGKGKSKGRGNGMSKGSRKGKKKGKGKVHGHGKKKKHKVYYDGKGGKGRRRYRHHLFKGKGKGKGKGSRPTSSPSPSANSAPQLAETRSPSVSPGPSQEETLLPTLLVATLVPTIDQSNAPPSATSQPTPPSTNNDQTGSPSTARPTPPSTNNDQTISPAGPGSFSPAIDLQPDVAPDNVVQIGRFTIDYTVESGIAADDASFAQVTEETLRYLEMYLSNEFALNNDASILEVAGVVVATDNGILQATFDAELVFDPTLSVTPSTDDVHVVVYAAFNEPDVQDFLALLAQQPDPFSTTTSVIYTDL